MHWMHPRFSLWVKSVSGKGKEGIVKRCGVEKCESLDVELSTRAAAIFPLLCFTSF